MVVCLIWCPGHSGIGGSELADKEAKCTAGGKDYGNSVPDSFAKCLPPPLDQHHLRKGLEAQFKLLVEWFWEDSAATVKHHACYCRVGPSSFLDLITDLPCCNAILL